MMAARRWKDAGQTIGCQDDDGSVAMEDAGQTIGCQDDGSAAMERRRPNNRMSR